MRFDPAAVPAALANRVLGRESWARVCLAAHAGRVFAVAVGPVATSMQIDASGTIESTPHPSGPPDLKLTISPLTVPSLLADPTRWDEFVAVDGDPALAATYGDRVPVLFAGEPGGGVELCHFRLDRARVDEALAGSGQHAD